MAVTGVEQNWRTRVRDSAATRPGRPGAFASHRAGLTMTAAAVILSLCAAACQSTAGAAEPNHAAATSAPAKPVAQLSITPANGTTGARTNAGVSVSVANGKLTAVIVKAHGATVAGVFNSTATEWRTKWPLHTSTRYTVTATATGVDGRTVTQTNSFRTIAASGYFTASTIEGYGQVYGVGMPIVIEFSQPVTHKRAIERAINITTSKPVVGAWMWDGNQVLAFRPRAYWPQHTQVSFTAHFKGLEAAPGVYGAANLSQTFTIGNSLIVVASTRTHYLRVWYKNKLLGHWPISTGKPGDDTANGTYLTIEKANPTRMKGNGYNVLVPLAVRFTWSGNYLHWAGWSVAQQGYVNVSHGCINLSPADAAIYYPLARPGDPVTVNGSPVAGTWDDGWTEWFWTWKQLLRHSATHLAVQAGPDGSAFVSPSSLPETAATGPLLGPKPNNYLAGQH